MGYKGLLSIDQNKSGMSYQHWFWVVIHPSEMEEKALESVSQVLV